MQKRVSILFTLMLLFQTIASGIVAPVQINAEGSKQPSIFTDLFITDEDGNQVEIEDLEEDSKVLVNAKWSVKDLEVEPGNSYSTGIDDLLEIIEQQEGSLTVNEAEETIEVGAYDISTDGIVTLTFNAEIVDHNNANGEIVVGAIVK